MNLGSGANCCEDDGSEGFDSTRKEDNGLVEAFAGLEVMKRCGDGV